MNEALANLLCARLVAAIPFLSQESGGRAVGLARLYTAAIQDGDSPRTVKLPVPITFTAEQCEQDSRYLMPDAGTTAILFFEDGGVQQLNAPQFPASLGIRTAALQLRLWVNPNRLDGPLAETTLVAAVEKALKVNERYASGDFVDVLTTATILPAETSLYGRYTFSDVTPLLLPPYKLLGLDLRVQFRLSTACITTPLPGAKDLAAC
jgi:hypothetical protein